MANAGTVTVTLLAKTAKFDRNVRSSTTKVMTLTATVQTLAMKVRAFATAALMALAPLMGAYGFYGLARSVEDFNQAMSSSTAIMRGLGAEASKAMEMRAFDVAKDTGFSPAEVAEGYYFLTSAGLDAAQSVQSLHQVAKFARAGMFDLATATDLATDAQSAMGLKSANAAENLENLTLVTDTLVGANTLANASVAQFSEAMVNKSAASARLVGMEMTELVSILAVYADQGKKGAEAGTLFSMALRDLTVKAQANKDAFKELGVNVYDSNGNLNDFADIVEDLTNLLGNLSTEQQAATVAQLGLSQKSIDAIKILLGTSDAMRKYNAELKTMNGITDEVANKQLPELTAATKRFFVALVQVSGIMAAPVFSVFASLLEKMSAWMERIAAGTLTTAEKVGVFLTVLVTVLFILPKLIALFRVMYTALRSIFAIKAAIMALAGPKAWIQLGVAVGVAAGAVVALDASMQELKADTESTRAELEKMMEAGGEVGELTGDALGAQLEEINDGLTGAGGVLQSAADLEREAQSLIDSMKTPAERYAEQIKKLGLMLKGELLTREQYAKAIGMALDDLASQTNQGAAVGIMEEGSAEAIQAQHEATEVYKRQEMQLEKIRVELEKQTRAMNQAEPVEITEVTA